MKMKKYLILALAISMLLTAMFTFAATAEGETTAPEIDLKIYAKNLALENSIYVSYAVPVEGTEGADSVKMLFWLTPQDSYTYGTQTYELSPEAATSTIGGKQYYVFEFDKLAAKQMTVDIYARVYATDGENEYYSKLDKYSILQYAYNMLGKTSTKVPTTKMSNLLNGMLAYGAYAQEYFEVNLDRPATANYYQIKVKNALLPDGADHGLYKNGTQLTLTASEKNAAGEDFLYWQNSAGEQISDLRAYTITVGNANETYIAVYGIKDIAPVEPLIYTKLADGTYSVKANPDVELPASIVIPSTYEGAAVTEIGENAFLDCTGITSILLPEGIKTIGDKAFSGCTGLSELEIPEAVKTIGIRAFHNCKSLTEIHIPASVTSIGTQIFYGCDNLSTVYYDSTYASTDNQFLSIKSIETVVFGGRYVPDYIAYNNTAIQYVTVLDGVQSVGYYSFYGCTSLKNVTIGNSVTLIDDYAFRGCTSLESVTLGNSVKNIDQSAFYGCTSLTGITIPDSVTSIGEWAFSNCSNLDRVYITDIAAWCKISFSDYWSNPMYYGADLYLNGELVTEVEIPDTVTKIGYTFTGCTSITSVTIPDSVTSIGIYAFYYCTSLTDITIPDSVTSISDRAFRNCTSLTGITIPDSVTSIGDSAFYNCKSLTSITIPDSVTSIGNYAFCDCTSLTGITIPDSVTSIGNFAFRGCTSLAGITIPDSVTSIGEYAFSNCTNLTGITIPDSVTSIGNYAFYNCASLAEINIPASVTSIGNNAFYNCNNLDRVYITDIAAWCKISFSDSWSNPMYYGADLYLNGELVTEVEIPDTVTTIKQYAFYNCNRLTGITIPDSVTSIGSSAFEGCTSLASITIPDSVTSIVNGAFRNCTSLTSITIGSSVTSIGYDAFYNCTNLKKVYYAGTAEQWAGISIGAFNQALTNASRYYYSEAQPSDTTDQYWHYVDGTPTIWNVLIYVSNGDGTCYISDAVVAGDFVIPSVSPTGDRVTGIGEFAFINCTAPVSITIPSSMTTISKSAFFMCTGLTSIIVPDSVRSIGQSAFYCCTNLSSVILSDGLTRIGSVAFSDCTSLKYIMIPDSVTAIDTSAFYACDGLEAVYYGGTEADWANIYISSVNNSSLTDATRYYYSETEPTTSGRYWHYVDGVPTKW